MKRRSFMRNSLAGGAVLGTAGGCVKQSAESAAGDPRQTVRFNSGGRYDLLLKGGRVIDPANGVDGPMDIAVSGDRIAAAARDIPATEGKKTVDAGGLCVAPGLIDIHGHFFGQGFGGFVADHHSFNSCVTTVVDAGTTGADNFQRFKEHIDRARVRILAFLNISRLGLPGNNLAATFDVSKAVDTVQKYPETIVGFKSVRYSYWEREDLGIPQTPAWESVDKVEEAGRLAGLPCMFHFDPEPDHGDWKGASQTEFLLEKTRPGDIYTHCFRRKHPVILDDGGLNPDFTEGRKRGIIFDVGWGANSCVWRNGITAIRQDFLPDSISTDIHAGNINSSVINMMFVMSKCLAMGMTLQEVIRLSTVNPAMIINRPELGTLSVGAIADIAVMEVTEKKMTFLDIHCDGNGGIVEADRKLEPVMTIFGGRTVFDPYGLGYRRWEDLPADNDYWRTHRTGLPLAPKEAYFKKIRRE